jgi:hypothetical protein
MAEYPCAADCRDLRRYLYELLNGKGRSESFKRNQVRVALKSARKKAIKCEVLPHFSAHFLATLT